MKSNKVPRGQILLLCGNRKEYLLKPIKQKLNTNFNSKQLLRKYFFCSNEQMVSSGSILNLKTILHFIDSSVLEMITHLYFPANLIRNPKWIFMLRQSSRHICAWLHGRKRWGKWSNQLTLCCVWKLLSMCMFGFIRASPLWGSEKGKLPKSPTWSADGHVSLRFSDPIQSDAHTRVRACMPFLCIKIHTSGQKLTSHCAFIPAVPACSHFIIENSHPLTHIYTHTHPHSCPTPVSLGSACFPDSMTLQHAPTSHNTFHPVST